MANIYNSDLDAFDLYHKQQRSPLTSILNGPALPALGHALAGSTGTAISNIAIYPLNLVITRLQVQRQLRNSSSGSDEGYKSVVDAFTRIYEKEGGVKALYKGVVTDTGKSVLDSFLFFLVYNYLRTERVKKNGGKGGLPAFEELVVGSLAGAASKLCTTPIANIVTRKQTASLLSSRSSAGSGGRDPTTKDIIDEIREEKGLQGFWSGYSASLVLTLNPSLTFFLYEMFKCTLLPRSKREDPGAQITFLMAAISKAIASTITFPFSVAKTRAQVSSSPPVDPASASHLKTDISSIENKTDAKNAGREVKRVVKRSTVFNTILRIYREEGLEGCYEGVWGEILKGFLGHGITMIVKERVHQLIIQAYYWVLRSLNKYPSPSELASQASQAATSATNSVSEKVGNAVTSGKEGVNSTIEVVSNVITSGTQSVSSNVSSGVERVGNIGTNAVSGAKTGEKMASEEAGHLLGNAREMLGDRLVQVGSEIKAKDE
ncbi:hypothetical protein HYALB_00012487 [Hymenoscyphus albidus]|uniref:Peroxisomal adenine nucleotide transporter 1 n=1 Tax=Hymenoscyphus albidus TaxID=595503 RepID=A0A9N9LTM9_9HELO|nr:hypothetical protein HYALB_00012487 [Hymenoscyphus albidus]